MKKELAGEVLLKAINARLSAAMQSFLKQKVDKSACLAVYNCIFEALVDVFKQSQIELQNETMNFVAQMFYDCAQFNKSQELDPTIFYKRAELTDIPTRELALMAMMFEGTDFRLPFISEIKRRS